MKEKNMLTKTAETENPADMDASAQPAETESPDGQIIFNIDVMLAKRKMSVTELAKRVGITLTNVSVLKNGKAKALKISTLVQLCKALDCQPGDILEYRKDGPDEKI